MGLFISPKMYRQVRGWLIVECPIEEFVYCNTRNDDIVDLLNKLSFPLERYNDYFRRGTAVDKKGRGVLMPFMDIRRGVAVDHDGRHRATALRNAGRTHVPVALLNVRAMSDLPDHIKGRYRGRIRKSDLLPHVPSDSL